MGWPAPLSRLFNEARLWLAVARLRRCRLFDPVYYRARLPAAPGNRWLALRHYLRYGAAAGVNPHPGFDSAHYLAANPDVAAAGINALLHYQLHGAAEGRQPLPGPAPAASRPRQAASPASPPAAVVFVTPLWGTPSGRYRVDHAVAALADLGVTARGVAAADLFGCRERLAAARVVVLHRVGWTAATGAVLAAARQAGAVLVFDSDDDVFSPGLSDNAGLVDGVRFLDPAQAAALAAGTLACRRALVACDAAMAATAHLAARMTAAGRPATVTRNTFGRDFAARCDAALAARASARPDGLVRLGYASGTPTHQRDFAGIAPVLARLLGRHGQLRLTVLGCLELAEFPDLLPYAGRIETRPLVAHADLPAGLARFDVNLAPLEIDNPFCRSKSEVKYVEAALLAVPTVASAIPAFAAAIDSGETGFVAADAGQWETGLETLVRDAGLRRQLGRAARDRVRRDYGPGVRCREWAAFLDRLPDLEGAGGWPRRPA